MRLAKLWVCCLATVSVAVFASAAQSRGQQTATRARAEQDPVLRALLAELDRNRRELQLPDSEKPYFIEFRIDDIVEYRARASYGALTEEQELHSRMVRARIRVGSYKLDNSYTKKENALTRLLERIGIGGDGTFTVETIDDNPLALRYSLWTAADRAYKQALDEYAKKQAEMKSVQAPQEVNSFSEEQPVVLLDPVQHLALDRAAWKRNIVEGSGLVLNDPAAKAFAAEIETSTGEVEGRVRTEYLVNSEGTIVRKSFSEYHAELDFSAQAPDGMKLERGTPFSAPAADDLPTPEHLNSSALQAISGLDALCKAPLVTDEYDGPVLLTGKASAHTFSGLLGRAVDAHVPALGSSVRTTGAYASSYRTRVLPDDFDVVDDPSLTTFDGKFLLGSYEIDDEGVPAQKVAIVQNGKLTNYLLGREPIRDFPRSNGHGRAAAGQTPEPRIGVLKIAASNSISEDELEKKLIAMGKERGLAYVYRIATLDGPMYRIRVSDGSREMVRGGRLADFTVRNLRTGIVAAGDQPYVYNSGGDVPQTVIAPPLLFDDLTIESTEQRNGRLPFYPAPSE